MTKDELKAVHTVPDILSRYGVRVRGGRCIPICHESHQFNAKVSRDLYYCFVCGSSMDIFDITMHFNHCDFKTACEILGGSEKPSWRTTVIVKKAVKERKEEAEVLIKQKERLRVARLTMNAYRELIKSEQPFSDVWCWCQNKIVYQDYMLDQLINEVGR